MFPSPPSSLAVNGGNSGGRRGSNQTQVGIYNERLVLDCVRRNSGISSADIVRQTGLSAQTVTGIVRRLLTAKLLLKQPRQLPRKIGQPAVPLALNGAGAYSAGVKIGRGSSEAMLINFAGEVVEHEYWQHDYPDARTVLPKLMHHVNNFRKGLGTSTDRFLGVGIAAPFGLSGWQDVFTMPPQTTREWTRVNIRKALSPRGITPLLVNDATAACIAENTFGPPPRGDNILYLYIGTFLGGGIIINRQVFFGANGNAGALGSMPLGRGQLINHASLHLLARDLSAVGMNLNHLRDGVLSARGLMVLRRWRRTCARALAQTVAAAMSIVDFEEVVIDGAIREDEVENLTAAVDGALTPELLRGLVRPSLRAGKQGESARCRGAAWLPLYTRYTPTPTVLLKEIPAVAV